MHNQVSLNYTIALLLPLFFYLLQEQSTCDYETEAEELANNPEYQEINQLINEYFVN